MRSFRASRSPHSCLLAWTLLTGALAVSGMAMDAAAQAASPGTRPDRPIVLGTGNRLSGRLPVVFVGPQDHFAPAAFRAFSAAVAHRCDLALDLRIVAELPAPSSPAALVLLGRVPTASEAAVLRSAASTVAVLGVDAAEALPPALLENAAVSQLRPGDPADAWLRDLPEIDSAGPGILAITRAGEKTPRLFAGPASTPERFEVLMLVLLRHTIENECAVRHVPSAFARIASRLDSGRLLLDVTTRLPGEITCDVLDLRGGVISPERPIRPLDLAAVPDPDRTLVRLRYRGPDRLADEARLWLRDLLPATLPAIAVRGPARLPAGEPLRLRVDVTSADQAPVSGAAVEARAGAHDLSAVTDAAGTTWLVSPAPIEAAEGSLPIEVRVHNMHFDRTVRGRVRIVPRPQRLLIETDRPVARPGEAVQVRAVLVDGISHRALPGQSITLEVKDPNDQLLVREVSTTGAFGEVVTRVPLGDALPAGNGTAEATLGAVSARCTFRVEEAVLARFRVRVQLGRDRFSPVEPITGVVEAETVSGEPLAGACVHMELLALRPHTVRTTLRLDERGAATFSLDAPAQQVSHPALHVTVEHHGAIVTKRVAVPIEGPRSMRIAWETRPSPLVAGVPGTVHVETRDEKGEPFAATIDWRIEGARPRAGSGSLMARIPVPEDQPSGAIKLHVRAEQSAYETDFPAVAELHVRVPIVEGVSLELPRTVRPGTTFQVSLQSARKTGLVHLDLSAGEQLLAGASVSLIDGRGAAMVTAPAGARGPALVVARFADQPGQVAAQQPIDLVTAPLAVTVTPARAEARPGETVACAVQVQDAAGHGIPALLDVRVADPVNREAWGDLTVPLRDELGIAPVREGASLLARFEPIVARAQLFVESDRIARPALHEAATAVRAGRARAGELPWGAKIQLTRIGDRVLLGAEPAVTQDPSHERARVPQGPGTVVHTSTQESILCVRSLLPPRPPQAVASERSSWGNWFQACQAPDGSFPVLSPRALARLVPEESLGDPWLEPGTTGLVVSAHAHAGCTHRSGPEKELVGNALDYLRAIQNAGGFFGNPEAPWAMLNHAMCTVALAELPSMGRDPELRPLAEQALSALAARQRPDGGFGEAGFAEASLVCTAWAALAIRAAKNADLEAPDATVAGIRRWLEARTDPATGLVTASREEIEQYPFTGTGGVRYAAALPALIRILLLDEDPEKHVVLQQLEKHLVAVPPAPGDRDLHGLYWGTAAAFQFGGPSWHRWNRAMKPNIVDTQIEGGAWPGDGRAGRVATTAFGTMCLAIYYRYGGFPRDEKSSETPPAGWFGDLPTADLAHLTAPDGRATVALRLPERITPWDVRIGAWDGRGGYGAGRATVHAMLPFHLEVDAPTWLHEGDRCAVPVRVHSALASAAEVAVEVRAAEGIAIPAKTPLELTIAAGGIASSLLWIEAGRPAPGQLVLEATSGTHRHVVKHAFTIRTRALPFVVSRPVRAGETIRAGDGLQADASRLRVELVVTADPIGDEPAGLDEWTKRIQEPCEEFEEAAPEWTMACLHAELLALRLLQATGRIGDELAGRARERLAAMYRRMLQCELAGGGFSFRDGQPAQADLTALAIHVLSDLKAVQAVDEAVITRAAAFLEQHVPEKPAERVYALAALVRAGRAVQDAVILDVLGDETDPYVLALAVCHGLTPDPLLPQARSRIEGAAVRVGSKAIWKSVRETLTLFPGDREFSWPQVTALAVEALIRVDGPNDLIEKGVATIRRVAEMGWPAGHEWVACLRVLLAATGAGPARGTLVVHRAQEPPRSLRIGGERRSARLDLGEVQADDRFHIAFEGEGTPHILLRITGASATPAAAEQGPLAVHAIWSGEPLVPGALAHCTVTLRDRKAPWCDDAVVEVPVPAGFRPDPVALAEAARRAGFCRAEVRSGCVLLARSWMPLSEAIAIRIPFVAGWEGRFHCGAVRTWSTEEPDATSATEARVIAVGDPAPNRR